MTPINARRDFVLLFDVRDGNPNGDPDAGNLPRIDAETGQGLVTDVALKRKIRNYVGLVKNCIPPFDIYIKERAVLERSHLAAYKAIGAEAELIGGGKESARKRKGSASSVEMARAWICENFFDVRTFGAVMSTGINCGQVRGPVQMTFARSIDPIYNNEHTITRAAVTNESGAARQDGDYRMMAVKHIVPYGLYRSHGFISSFLARQTGFSDEDLELLLCALEDMFEHDRSAARGHMSTRGLYVFNHVSELGNAHAHSLFDRLVVAPLNTGNVSRSFDAYSVKFDGISLEVGEEALAAPGVTVVRRR